MGLLDGWSLDPNDPASSGAGTGSLLNPKMLPLLYAAAAAGQAATPSRLPVPLGSVMGQIAGGLGAGMQAGQQGQLSQQELYGRQTQNALNALTLRGYQRLQQENGGNPATTGGALAASMTPGGATSAPPAASGSAVDANASPGPAGTYLTRLASFESGGDPNAQNPKSSALGPYQFTSGTWDDVYKKYLGPRGLPNDPTDPTASAVGAAAYASENAPVLSNALNRSPQESELAMAHFLGAAGAVKMLQGNPDRPATDFASTQAVTANPKMFYREDGTNRSAGELRAIFDQRFAGGAPAAAPVPAAVGAVTPRQAAPPGPGVTAAGIPGLTAPGVMGGGTTSPSVYASAPPSILNQPGQGSVLAGSPQTAGSFTSGTLLGGPATGSAPQPQAAPLFDMAGLYKQYRLVAGIPGMQGVAGQILGLITKNLPEGAQLLQDGSIAPRPGFDQFVMGRELAAKGYTQQPNGTWALNPGVIAGEGAVAGAKKQAELPYTLTTARPGNVVLQGGRPIYQNPVQIPGVTPSGAPTTNFVTPAMPTGNPGAAPPGGGALTPTGTPSPIGATGPRPENLPATSSAANNPALPPNTYVTGLDPLTKESLEKRGGELEDYGAKLQTSASDAVNGQFLIDQMRRESGNGAGWVPGRFADWGGELRALFNGVLPNASESINAALANYQAFEKNSMALTTQATRAVSPRAAVQEMQMIRQALPNANLSSGGLSYIFDSGARFKMVIEGSDKE